MLEVAGGILIAFVVLFCLPQFLATILIFLAIIIVGFILLSLHNSMGLPIVILTCFVIFCFYFIVEFIRNDSPDHWTRISFKINLTRTREIVIQFFFYVLFFCIILLFAHLQDLIFR
jgi:hypothetical protein